jgi:4-amino-4-deoxy-L-arabinose transferase-like glycosyltransferase
MFKFLKEWKMTIIFGLGILLFGLIIRVLHINSIPVFADEAIYVRWSQVMNAEPTLRFLPLSDGKQPLFMWALMFIVKRFSDPLMIGRFLSIFCGIGTMITIFAISYVLFKNKVIALLSSFIWAISPFSFFFDRMALVDSMLAMFGALTFLGAILVARTKRLDAAMLTGFALGFALLTKSPAIFFVLLIPSTCILTDSRKSLPKLFLLTIVTFVIGYGMYNILRLGPNFNLISSRNEDYVLPISHLWTNPKDPFIFHIEEIFTDWFVKMGPWPILILGVIGSFVGWKKYLKEKLVLLAWLSFPILVQSEYAKVFTVRYILFTLPAFFIIAGISFMPSKTKPLKIITTISLLLFVILSMKFNYLIMTNPQAADLPSSERSGYLEEWTAGYGIKDVAEYVKNEYQKDPSKQIVVGTEGYFGTLPDGLQIYLDKYPKIVVIGTGLGFKDVPSQLKDAKKAGNKTYFVVNSSRIVIKAEDYDKFGLKLIASFPKALRREHQSHEYVLYGERESLLFFEVK